MVSLRSICWLSKRLNFEQVFSSPSGWYFFSSRIVFWCTFSSINFFLSSSRSEIVLQSGLFLLIFQTPKAIVISMRTLHRGMFFMAPHGRVTGTVSSCEIIEPIFVALQVSSGVVKIPPFRYFDKVMEADKKCSSYN